MSIAYAPPQVTIMPDVRAEIDARAAADGYRIEIIRDFAILLPSEHDKDDPLGMRGYFGFSGSAVRIEDFGLIEFSCLWRMMAEGSCYRLRGGDAGREIGSQTEFRGWLPHPERVILEGDGQSWILRRDRMKDKPRSVKITHLDGSVSVMSEDTVPAADEPRFIGWSTIAERREAAAIKEKQKKAAAEDK